MNDIMNEANKLGVKIVEGSGGSPVLNGVRRYYERRDPNDLNVYELLLSAFDKAELPLVKHVFLSDPSLVSIAKASSDVQRVIINKHFRLQMLRFAGVKNVSIVSIFLEFFNESELEGWLERIYTKVCGFIKHHQVYEELNYKVTL